MGLSDDNTVSEFLFIHMKCGQKIMYTFTKVGYTMTAQNLQWVIL